MAKPPVVNVPPPPPVPGDPLPATEARVPERPQLSPGGVVAAQVSGHAAEVTRLSAEVGRRHTDVVALRRALEAWMTTHGAACACDRCVATRGVLAETRL